MNDASKVEVERIEQGFLIEDLTELGKREIENVVPEIDTYDVETTSHVLIGRPDKEVLNWIATNEPDLVVMGSRGETGLTRIALGSVAENVARRTSVPVQLVDAESELRDEATEKSLNRDSSKHKGR